jgi:hypothetical protein
MHLFKRIVAQVSPHHGTEGETRMLSWSEKSTCRALATSILPRIDTGEGAEYIGYTDVNLTFNSMSLLYGLEQRC